MRKLLFAILCASLLVLPVSGAPQGKYIALTFDDGPSGSYTRELLDGLRERNVKATFLLCGYRIKDYPREAQQILDDGHEVGNHGYSHKNMQALGRREIADEIMDTQALLPEGTRIRFLRPPGGCCSDGVRQVAEARQLSILSWSVDPRDWATKDADAVSSFVIQAAKDGDIILLHDMSSSSVQAALAIIDKLTEEGFHFVTASELAAIRGVSLKPGKSYGSFPPQ